MTRSGPQLALGILDISMPMLASQPSVGPVPRDEKVVYSWSFEVADGDGDTLSHDVCLLRRGRVDVCLSVFETRLTVTIRHTRLNGNVDVLGLCTWRRGRAVHHNSVLM